MRNYIFTGLLFLFAVAAVGCSAQQSDSGQDANVPSIMVEGTLYRYDEPNQTIEIAEVDILGHITSVVDSSRIPEKDGKSNCNFPGAPYARWSDEEHPDAVVVYINDVWTIFTAWDPEADWESFRAQREQD